MSNYRYQSEEQIEAGERDDGSAYEPPGPTVNGTIPEHVRRERGQTRVYWRTSSHLSQALSEHASDRGEGISEALDRIVAEALGLDAGPRRLHHQAKDGDG